MLRRIGAFCYPTSAFGLAVVLGIVLGPSLPVYSARAPRALSAGDLADIDAVPLRQLAVPMTSIIGFAASAAARPGRPSSSLSARKTRIEFTWFSGPAWSGDAIGERNTGTGI